jgi:hypothetical protein
MQSFSLCRERCLLLPDCGGFQISANWKSWHPRLLKKDVLESDTTCTSLAIVCV